MEIVKVSYDLYQAPRGQKFFRLSSPAALTPRQPTQDKTDHSITLRSTGPLRSSKCVLLPAAICEEPSCLQALIGGGANVEAVGEGGQRPLHRAAQSKIVDLVKVRLSLYKNRDCIFCRFCSTVAQRSTPPTAVDGRRFPGRHLEEMPKSQWCDADAQALSSDICRCRFCWVVALSLRQRIATDVLQVSWRRRLDTRKSSRYRADRQHRSCMGRCRCRYSTKSPSSSRPEAAHPLLFFGQQSQDRLNSSRCVDATVAVF